MTRDSERMTTARTTQTAMAIGIVSARAAEPAIARTRIASSVAYAEDEMLSDAKIASPVFLESRSPASSSDVRRVDAWRRDVVAPAATELAGRGTDDPHAAVADLRSGVSGALLERRRVGAFLATVIASVAHPPRPAARGRRGDTGRRARPCCAVRIAVASTAARSGCGAELPTSAAARTPRGRR